MRICLITPDLVGPVKNGGIGTYACHAARLLASAGHAVTLVFTRRARGVEWRSLYEGIELLTVDDLPVAGATVFVEDEEAAVAWRVDRWLRGREFDVVHFQEWAGNGACAVAAKRNGLAHHEKLLCVMVHSPTLWHAEGMDAWPEDARRERLRTHLERESVSGADHVLSPSQHMLEWLEAHGWRTFGDRSILRLPFLSAEGAGTEAGGKDSTASDPTHLIFFGRLEVRKGFAVFLEALTEYLQTHPNGPIRRVSFLGKETRVGGIPARRLIKRLAARAGQIEIRVETDWDAFRALDYIRRSRGVVFLPSLMDNSPLAVIECIEAGATFFASARGGISELCHPDRLFEPTVAGLRAVLDRLPARFPHVRHPYEASAANAAFLEWHANLGKRGQSRSAEPACADDHPRIEEAAIPRASESSAEWLVFREDGADLADEAMTFLRKAIKRSGADMVTGFFEWPGAAGSWLLRRRPHGRLQPLGVAGLGGWREGRLAGPVLAVRRVFWEAVSAQAPGLRSASPAVVFTLLALRAALEGRRIEILPEILCRFGGSRAWVVPPVSRSLFVQTLEPALRALPACVRGSLEVLFTQETAP